MRGQKGFTLIELLIVIAVIAIVASIFAGGLGFLGSSEEVRAPTEDMMMDYVKFRVPEATPENTDIMCQPGDTDGDGYVRCEAIVRLPDEEKNVRAECPFAISFAKFAGNKCTFVKVPVIQ